MIIDIIQKKDALRIVRQCIFFCMIIINHFTGLLTLTKCVPIK